MHCTAHQDDSQEHTPAQNEHNQNQMDEEDFEAAKGPEEHGDTLFKSEDNEADVVPTTEHGDEDAGGLFGSGSEGEGSP